nr:hypothetical protein [Tanacetum cinerariifolium]
MTTPTVTSSTDSQMHNNIMAVGSRDRPPMLATGRYAQWRSRFLRYIDTRSNGDALRKCILSGKEIAKPITPPSETVFEEENDPEQAQRDKDMQKNLALIAKYFKKIYKPTNNNLRTSSISRNKSVDTTPCPVVQQYGIQCFNCKEFGHFAKECRKPKRVKDFAYHKEKMLLCKQAEKGVPLQAKQYDWLEDTDEEIDKMELEAHYSYMEKIYEIQKQLKKANTTLAQELKEYKTILAETSKTLGESNSVRDSCLVALQNKQTEFEKYKAFKDCIVDYDKLKYQFCAPTAQDMQILIQTCLMPLSLKTHNDSFIFVHELKQEMPDDLKYVESLKQEIDELESDKAEFSNMYDMILQELKECDCLVPKLSKQTESVSNEVHAELLQRFAKVKKHSISLEIALQKCKEQVKNDTVWNEQASNVFRKEREQSIEIQDLKAQLQDKNIAIKVASQKSTCFVRDLQGNDLLTGNRGSLYKDVVIGLPKLKFIKDQLCSSCELSKAKRSSFKSKAVPSSKGRLNLLHMDLCGPMRVADETPKVLKEFLTMIQRNLQALVITVRTNRGTEFLNKTFNAFFKEEGIEHQTSTARTPEQNGVVERQNRTLSEATRTMLSALKLPLFFWAEAIVTACYTQNRSIIISTHDKMVLGIKCTRHSHCQERVPTGSISSHCQAWRETLILGDIPTISSHSYCPNSQKKMDHQYTTLAKIPVLDTGKFEQWQFQIQQYLQLKHYALWEVIQLGDSYKKKKNDVKKKKNDVKARTTLLLSLPDEHQLRFNKYKTARELWAAILKTFGGNKATKKRKKNILKQQYGNFKAEGTESLEQTFNRLQVIVSQLQFMDVDIEKDD